MSQELMESSKSKLITELRLIVPSQCLLFEEEQLAPYECDGLSAYRQLPMLVVLPETIEQIQAIMKLCSQQNVPVIARGAGTGLSGGALPRPDSILLSLAKFNKIKKIDRINQIAVVEPGVRNISISEAAKEHNLYYAPDPSSQIACTIGGNVAENAGGVHCLKYGLTVHNISSLKIINIEGELISIGDSGLDSAGYDFLALLTGSEGLLGIIIEITVKLLVIPPKATVLLAAFNSIEKAGAAVANIIAAGIIPAGLEMMDQNAVRAAEAFAHAGYPTDAQAILLCELDGLAEEVDALTDKSYKILMAADAVDIKISRNDEERLIFWKGRKAAFPAVGRITPDYYCMDGTIPRKHLAKVLKEISRLSDEYGLAVANVFHAGDGNLHPLILYDANKPGELERTEEFGGKILELCISVGGTITGEHGVGIEKIDHMCIQFSKDELEFFRKIKQVFDPNTLLNPGKAIPTLSRCAEFGAMHVHSGDEKFPELERF